MKKIVCQQQQEVNLQFLHHQKVTPIWPLLSVQTGSQSLILKKSYLNNHQSTLTVFAPLYRSLIVKIYLQKVTPIWPLLPVQTGSQSLIFQKIISEQPQEVNSQSLHHCSDR